MYIDSLFLNALPVPMLATGGKYGPESPMSSYFAIGGFSPSTRKFLVGSCSGNLINKETSCCTPTGKFLVKIPKGSQAEFEHISLPNALEL